MSLFAALLLGFLIGGLPTGVIICRLCKGTDPRHEGSGSSGATNVSRVLGKGWAAVVLLIDVAKGFLPIHFLLPLLIPRADLSLGASLMAAGAVAGHVWTPYARFRGGKGVATAAGALLAIDPTSLFISLGIWAVAFGVSRIASLASLLAAVCLPISMFVLGKRPKEYILLGIAIAVLVAFTHRTNIIRLISAQEKRII